MAWRLLCYHGVAPELRAAFGRQLDSLGRNGWRYVEFDDGLQGLEAGTLSGKAVTPSFDDGDATQCEQAQPELDARGIKAMLYLSTDFVQDGTVYRLRARPRAADWDQLGRWIEAGHAIGSHTHRHCNLVHAPDGLIEEETERSRELIERELGVTVRHFSYPWGQHDRRVRAFFAASAGWRSAATIDRGWNRPGESPFALKRDLVEPGWSAARLRASLRLGASPWLYAVQRRLRGLGRT